MKKIYLAGAIIGSNEKLLNFYEQLAKQLRNLDFEVFVPHENSKKFDLNDPNSDRLIYKEDMENLRSSNIVLAYIGLPSIGTGAEIAFIAPNSNYKIVSYYQKDEIPSRFITGFLKMLQRPIVKILNLDIDSAMMLTMIVENNCSPDGILIFNQN